MIARATFFFVAAFWLTMNVLLWRAEYGSHNTGISIPVNLVWRKILTAPDTSSLTIYQHGERTGFCEFSTSVEQAMAALDEEQPPPEGMVARAGYQIRLDGNIGLGSLTNRLKFGGHLKFSANHQWRELDLKIFSHLASVEIHSFATNQNVHLKITGDGAVIERDVTFTDLQNPTTLLRSFSGDFAGGLLDTIGLPVSQNTATLAQNLHWEAHRYRLMIGREPVSAYRLETQVLQNPIIIYVSTLGEILRVELPGGIVGTLDEWNKS